MVKFLGFFDLIAAALLVGIAYQLSLPTGMVIAFAIYLFLKGLLFFADALSWFDAAVGIVLILSLFMSLPPLLLFILAGFLGVKGFLSLFA